MHVIIGLSFKKWRERDRKINEGECRGFVFFTVVFFIVFVLNFWSGEDPSKVTRA